MQLSYGITDSNILNMYCNGVTAMVNLIVCIYPRLRKVGYLAQELLR